MRAKVFDDLGGKVADDCCFRGVVARQPIAPSRFGVDYDVFAGLLPPQRSIPNRIDIVPHHIDIGCGRAIFL